ncbi:MAG: hypothetical protein QOD55_2815 [Solirubrobacteraceae bacterium]|nr:hypothetical protein [Solirubrobacteraceae bacterium]
MGSSQDHLAELHRQRLRVERANGASFDDGRGAHVVCRVCDAEDDIDRAIGMCPSCRRALGLSPP